MMRPEQPEPIEGMYDALYALALRGRELGSGTFVGAMNALPEGAREYLLAMNIPEKNIDGILFGLAWGLQITND